MSGKHASSEDFQEGSFGLKWSQGTRIAGGHQREAPHFRSWEPDWREKVDENSRCRITSRRPSSELRVEKGTSPEGGQESILWVRESTILCSTSLVSGKDFCFKTVKKKRF
ncbi:hypothetical protein Y032_0018g3721 [Ancylostoma ceylanicum]|uniref:Uncharacterized protein n=1 Tax=Ancylostoma ceylanicum TaxID=53326 RepID=A0A016V4E6_9BILA|nr:hypothetical protein Y032_0018g3721 [Ancylostoma ceylanicum]